MVLLASNSLVWSESDLEVALSSFFLFCLFSSTKSEVTRYEISILDLAQLAFTFAVAWERFAKLSDTLDCLAHLADFCFTV